MKLRQRIGVIGCGTMGIAILRGLRTARHVTAGQTIGADPTPARAAVLRRLGVRRAPSNLALVQASNVVIVAVKPQQMRDVLREIAPELTSRHLVISIAAGISTRQIERVIGASIPVVRAMPNTPAQIRQGMSVLCGGRAARASHRATARAIFDALGETLELPERLFHAVTAISGSGPAYLFLLMEAMLAAGRHLELPPAALDRLVRQTVVGSAQLAAASTESPSILRQRVTSKGGTTEAALRTFARRRVPQALIAGIEAAARRAHQLGG